MFRRSPIEEYRKIYQDDAAEKYGIRNPVYKSLFGGEIDLDKDGFLVK